MSAGQTQLPQDDLRAQEMVFWLKKLSLEIPEAIKPVVDLEPILRKLESQACQIAKLESLLMIQTRMLASQSKVLSRQVSIVHDVKQDLIQLRRDSPGEDKLQTPSSSWTTNDERDIIAVDRSSSKSQNVHTADLAVRQSPVLSVKLLQHDHTNAAATQAMRELTPEDLTQSQPLKCTSKQKNRVLRNKRRILSVQTSLQEKLGHENVLARTGSLQERRATSRAKTKRNLL